MNTFINQLSKVRILLLIIVIVVGIFAGWMLMKQNLDIRERAEEVGEMCPFPTEGVCIAEKEIGRRYNNYKIFVYEGGVLLLPPSELNADKLEFTATPGNIYECVIKPFIDENTPLADPYCEEKGAVPLVCYIPTGTPTITPTQTPTPTPTTTLTPPVSPTPTRITPTPKLSKTPTPTEPDTPLKTPTPTTVVPESCPEYINQYDLFLEPILISPTP